MSKNPTSTPQADPTITAFEGRPTEVEQKVRVRAHQLSEDHRGVNGLEEKDWLEAEAQVQGEQIR